MEEILCCEQCGAPLTERGSDLGCLQCLLQGGMEPAPAVAASSSADFGTRTYQHYRILLQEDGSPWELGRGAMGITYKAIDVTLRMPVALKVLNGRFSTLPGSYERFLGEAQAAAQLRHPNVASIFHFGAVNVLPALDRPLPGAAAGEEEPSGDCFYAMEFVEGETLEARLRRVGPISPELALEIGLQVARALAAAEKRGLVHRDLKPANIMLRTTDGSTEDDLPLPDASEAWVKVIDFGLAQADLGEEKSSAAGAGRFVGTRGFASPEQLQGQRLDLRSDIYSLGCTLWYALSGEIPERSPKLDARDVPVPLRRLLESMLATDTADRPASGAELVAALKSCQRAPTAQAAGSSARFFGGARRRALLAAAGLLATLVGLGFYLLRPGASIDEKSIALLPFKNLSADPANDFFAEGLEDDLVANLVKIRDLKVVGLKGLDIDTPAHEPRNLASLGQTLGVRHVLQGSLRRVGDRVLLQVSLVDTRDGRVRWAEHYDRALSHVVGLQGELAASIVDTLDARLTWRERKNITAAPTDDAGAYILYLNGLKLENSPIYDVADYEAARVLYMQALALDPDFALVHARLSSTLGLLYRFRGPTAWLKEQAFAEARESLRLDPDLGAAHMAQAFYYYRIDRNFNEALAELEIAHRLLPNDPEPESFIAYIDRRKGDWRQAEKHLQQVTAHDPENFIFAEELYATACLLRDWPSATKLAQRLRILAPKVPQVEVEVAYLSIWSAGDLAPIQRIFSFYTGIGDLEGDVTWARWDSGMLARDFAKARGALDKYPHETLPSVFAAPLPKSYLQGCIDLAQGDVKASSKHFASARPAMEAESRAHPEDAIRHERLGLLYAYMGRKADAIREGERAVQLQPISADAYDGPERMCTLALIHARVGDNEKAISMIRKLLQTPGCISFYEASMSISELRLRWQWDPLRSDPRFQEILAGPEPKTIY